jgi:hypothetical protein
MALRAALSEGGVKKDDVAEYQEQLLENPGREVSRGVIEARHEDLVSERHRPGNGRISPAREERPVQGGNSSNRHDIDGTLPRCSGLGTLSVSGQKRLSRSPLYRWVTRKEVFRITECPTENLA